MRKIVNKGVSLFLRTQFSALLKAINNPEDTQNRVFKDLLRKGTKTLYGKDHGFSDLKSYHQFSQNVPLQTYDSIKPYIKLALEGRSDILWPGRVKWFAKSSGTTSDKSKYIPVTNLNLYRNHIKSSWDTVSMMYHFQDVKMFQNKCLILCGNIESYEGYPESKIGDVSAILISNMQAVAKPFYTPDFETALIKDWELKIDRIAKISSSQNVSMVGGVPTWNIVLFRKILEITGKRNMLEVWPNFKIYMHGGVGFDPYRKIFTEFFPSDEVLYQEIYNASEGYFASQDLLDHQGLLLLINNGIFYEFIPISELDNELPKAVPLWEVKEGINYAIVISTNAGLWRYIIGDTVQFKSISPYRISITGRTKNYINAFGEEVMISNTDEALARACSKFEAKLFDYTVAPIFLSQNGQGAHEWLIEFEEEPKDLNGFKIALDQNLKDINSDYEAKRYKNLALIAPTVYKLPRHTFQEWLKSKGKQGAQIKVPRLSNDRKYVEEILEFVERNRIHV